jgi:hypothetical protein
MTNTHGRQAPAASAEADTASQFLQTQISYVIPIPFTQVEV